VNVSELEAFMTGSLASTHGLGGKSIDALEWSNARVTLGVPQAGVDFDESTSPREAGLEGRAVSFTKGCFPGQEVVARQRRGGATRQLFLLDVERDERLVPGSIVCGQSGEPLGRITSVASASGPGVRVSALAYLTGPFAVPGAQVVVQERTAEVRSVVGQSWPPSGTPGISA
jgi:folate-binding protein YgfZ